MSINPITGKKARMKNLTFIGSDPDSNVEKAFRKSQ